MAVQPDTTSGTLTTLAGSINFTTSGTNLLTREHLPGDRFLVNGLELQIATITGENTGTLTEVCPPSAAVSGYPVRLRFQPDGARVAAQTRNLIDLIGNGTIQSLAELDGQADELIGFLGPNTLTTFNITDLIQGADYDVQVDTLAGRDAYNNRPANYSVLVSDIGDGRAAIYVKRSDTDGDWSNPAYVTGAIGAMPTIEAGPTTTVSPTTPANVTVTPNGSGGYTLNFSIPQGVQGMQGIQGIQGEQGNGLEIDAVGSLADRDTYNSQPEGFTFFDTENGNLYFRVGASGNWSDSVSFQGPPGDDGALITTTSGTGNGTTGPYTLNAAPLNSDSVWVTISGVEQYDYTISGNQITFGISVPNGVPWRVKTSGPLPVGTAQAVDAGIINAASISNNNSEKEAIRIKIDAASTSEVSDLQTRTQMLEEGSVRYDIPQSLNVPNLRRVQSNLRLGMELISNDILPSDSAYYDCFPETDFKDIYVEATILPSSSRCRTRLFVGSGASGSRVVYNTASDYINNYLFSVGVPAGTPSSGQDNTSPTIDTHEFGYHHMSLAMHNFGVNLFSPIKLDSWGYTLDNGFTGLQRHGMVAQNVELSWFRLHPNDGVLNAGTRISVWGLRK